MPASASATTTRAAITIVFLMRRLSRSQPRADAIVRIWLSFMEQSSLTFQRSPLGELFSWSSDDTRGRQEKCYLCKLQRHEGLEFGSQTLQAAESDLPFAKMRAFKHPDTETEKRRCGRKAKLPKMNNSERGKYYRQKHQEHEEALVATVHQLRRQVESLKGTLHNHRQALNTTKIIASPSTHFSVAVKLLKSMSRRALSRYDFHEWHRCTTVPLVVILEEWQVAMSHPVNDVFELESFTVVGSKDAPIISINAVHRLLVPDEMIQEVLAEHPSRDIQRVRRLNTHHVEFQTQTQLYFSRAGELVHHKVETNFFDGFSDAVGDLTLACELSTRLQICQRHWLPHRSAKSRVNSSDNNGLGDVVEAAKMLIAPSCASHQWLNNSAVAAGDTNRMSLRYII